mmetsp:Transcript_110580/g.308011  ORF Transcript_110580/g.308011 Transcript_110580/m.308011 type:complete len:251 (-) Transcript_110580:319-1071(-)
MKRLMPVDAKVKATTASARPASCATRRISSKERTLGQMVTSSTPQPGNWRRAERTSSNVLVPELSETAKMRGGGDNCVALCDRSEAAAEPAPLPRRGWPRAASNAARRGCRASIQGTLRSPHSRTIWVQRAGEARVKMTSVPAPPVLLALLPTAQAASTTLRTSAHERTSGCTVSLAASQEPNCAHAHSASRRAPLPVLSETAKMGLGWTSPAHGVTSKSMLFCPSGLHRVATAAAARHAAILQLPKSRC